MSTAIITWTDPTTLVDGKSAIPANDFAFVQVQVSIDGGKTYTVAGHAAPGAQTFSFEADDPGTYLFKVNSVDTQIPPTVSPDSAVVQVTVAAPPLQSIAAPTNVAAALSA
jgi:uncharacterized protein YfaP (DUF2135 family)